MTSVFRLLLLPVGGVIVALLQFWLMAKLVQFDKKGSENSASTSGMIDFVRLNREEATATRERFVPRPPKPSVVAPSSPQVQVSTETSTQENNNALDLEVPTFGSAGGAVVTGFGSAGAFTSGAASVAGRGDQDVLPSVRIEPQYPREAASKGIEGYAVLEFTITAAGTTADVKVVDSKPRGVFNRAAIQAVQQWKYKPQIVDGKAVEVPGMRVQLDFSLSGEE